MLNLLAFYSIPYKTVFTVIQVKNMMDPKKLNKDIINGTTEFYSIEY